MANYSVEITRSAEKVLLKLPKQAVVKIMKRIVDLSHEPYPPDCRKLAGEDSFFRIRVRNYRIIYEVFEKKVVVVVLKVGHRKDIYRR